MFSFQGVRIAVYRGVLTVYRDALISGCWDRGVPLYTEVSSFWGVGIEGFHCIWCWNRGFPLYMVLEWRGSTVYGIGMEGVI